MLFRSARTNIRIEYGQDIEHVEEVLKQELPGIRERNPKILDGPTYLGVSELGESGVDILVICKCSERDVKGITRYLNKEVLQIFYRNGITVPFPHITVVDSGKGGRQK